MPPAGFEPINPASERQQTYALDRADTGTGNYCHFKSLYFPLNLLEPELFFKF